MASAICTPITEGTDTKIGVGVALGVIVAAATVVCAISTTAVGKIDVVPGAPTGTSVAVLGIGAASDAPVRAVKTRIAPMHRTPRSAASGASLRKRDGLPRGTSHIVVLR